MGRGSLKGDGSRGEGCCEGATGSNEKGSRVSEMRVRRDSEDAPEAHSNQRAALTE